MAHTPGPWSSRKYKNKTNGIWIDGGFKRNRSCGTVAECYPVTDQAGNVSLIQAAPETLAALKDLVRCIERDNLHTTHGVDLRKARAAIAKAELIEIDEERE